MSWPNFLAPWWGLLGLLAIPLIALYLLRQKRPNLQISSTLLWSKTLADMRASTPFQRLRRNLLLLLQLLILAALTLTLMRPVIRANAGQTTAGVIVIDATASMQTTDGGGPSRLDRAKQQAKKLVETMRPGDRFKIIIDGGGLNRAGYDFTSSKSDLLALIAAVKPSDSSSDLSESLILAAESLRAIGGQKSPAAAPKTDTLTPGQVWLFSDGVGVHVPDVMGKTANLLHFVKIGDSDHSVGVTQLSVTPVPKQPNTFQVFVGLKNAWHTPHKIGVLLALGSKDNFLPDQAQSITLPAEGQGGLVFEKVVANPSAGGDKLFVRVDDTDDDFLLDNTAYAILQPPRKVKVLLVTKGNQVLENFLKAAQQVGEIDGIPIAPAALASVLAPGNPAPPDLVILDGFVPNVMPKADTLMIRPDISGAGDVGGFKVTAMMNNPPVLDWKRESPVMQYVELTDLRVSHALMIQRDPEIVELANAPEAPLIAYKDFGPTRRYFVAFSPLLESNWWQNLSFVLFLKNVVEQTRLRHYIGIPQLVTTGSPARLWDVGNETGAGSAAITLPDGSSETVPVKDAAAEFDHTASVGFYQVASNGKHALFAANLLNADESDIAPRSLQTDDHSNVKESTNVVSWNKEVWQWLAIAALAVLLLEWWVYHRRIA